MKHYIVVLEHPVDGSLKFSSYANSAKLAKMICDDINSLVPAEEAHVSYEAYFVEIESDLSEMEVITNVLKDIEVKNNALA